MKVSPRLLTAFCALALLAGGCSKKKPTAVTRNDLPAGNPAAAEPTAPATEPSPAPTTTPQPDTAAAPAPAAPAASPGAGSAPAPAPGATVDGIPADLAAQDAAYEAWFKKYNLDLSDPKMLDDDPDGDGFTNREEFLADTNPRDPNSHPGLAKNIRLKEYVRKDLPFVLKSVQGETAEMEREEDGGTKRKESVKPGQQLAGSTYKVLRVQSKPLRDKDGNLMDGSRVTLEDSATKHRVELIKDMPARSSESYAVLTSPDGKQTVHVKDGETFTWPSDPPVTYRVKDLRPEQAILEEVGTRKTITVPKE
jgi:hypothetical protein